MDVNLAITQISWAAIAVWIIQRLKKWPKFTILTEQSQTWVKQLSSVVAAIGFHTGIHFVWSTGPLAGSHALLVTIPPLTVILLTLGHWLQQFVLQELIYQGVVKKNGLPPAKPV